MSSVRAFVAVEIPQHIREGLTPWFQGQRRKISKTGIRGIKWVEPNLWHITMKFIGEMEDALIKEASQILHSCARCFSPFSIRLKGLGAFPSPVRPKVLWIGVEEMPKTLGMIYKTLDSAFMKLGVPSEERRFHPHLTIGRVKTRHFNLKSGVPEVFEEKMETQWFQVSSITLFKSTLTPKGPIYTPISTARLKDKDSTADK